MAEEKKKKEAEAVEIEAPKKEKKKVDVEAFIRRKMKAINEMENHATARYLAERVISNRKEN